LNAEIYPARCGATIQERDRVSDKGGKVLPVNLYVYESVSQPEEFWVFSWTLPQPYHQGTEQ
jgi:hypothetical protein